MIPDSLAVPWKEGSWTVATVATRSIVRRSAQLAWVCDAANLATLLPLQLASAGAPSLIDYYADVNEGRDSFSVETAYHGQARSLLQHLPDRHALAANLLQGAYRLENPMEQHWLQWRPVVWALAFAEVMHLGGMMYDTMQLNKQVAAYRADIESVFRGAFPEITRVVDPKAQMTQAIAKLDTSAARFSILPVLQQITPALAAMPEVKVTRLNFEQLRGELRLDVGAADYAKLEAFSTALTKTGVTATLGAVSGKQNAYTARITIKGQ